MSSIIDPLFAGVMFVVFGICVIVSLTVFNSIDSTTTIFGSMSGAFNQFYVSMNNVAIFIMLAMSLGAVLSAYLIKSTPVFFIVAVILIFVQAIVMPSVVQGFNSVVSDATFTTAAGSLNLVVFLAEKLPIFTIIASALAAVLGILRS